MEKLLKYKTFHLENMKRPILDLGTFGRIILKGV
jgi:hypothetical protein